MARIENTVPVNLAVGATLKEVPGFVLGEWGSIISKFSKKSSDLSAGLNVIKALHIENGVDISQVDTTLIPDAALGFFSGKRSGVEVHFSPKMNEVLIHQEVKAGKRNRKIQKTIHILIDENGLIKEATFVESFDAPNSDSAARVVQVEYGLGGEIDKITDIRTIRSNIDYLASGLPKLPHSINLEDGRSHHSQIVYAWEKDKMNPTIKHVEDTETLRRTDIHIDIMSTILARNLQGNSDIQRRNKRAIGIDAVQFGEQKYPYGYLSKMLPPDMSLGKLLPRQ